jgi:CubicO group peptidase (beta-lactamase class C family)
MPLDVYFDKRIFAPLGMSQTGFNVPGDDQSRVVQPGKPQAGATPTFLTDLSRHRQFLSGGGGLVGGIDYGIFCGMLLGGGTFEGTRVLGAKSVALVTSDQIGTLADHPSFNLGPSYTFGLGVFVRRAKDPAHPYANVGEFGWWGGAGTAFWGDPKARICGVLLTQQPDESRYYVEKFRALVYDALKPDAR